MNKHIGVILVNFSDSVVNFSVQKIDEMMFSGHNNVADYFESMGITLTGDVIGPITIPLSSQGHDYGSWSNKVDELVDIRQYDHRIYVFPDGTAPGIGIGQAEVGGERIWMFRHDLPDGYAHELGHNFGLFHADTDRDLGDTSCMMGSSGPGFRHFNAPHKEKLGLMHINHASNRIYTLATDNLRYSEALKIGYYYLSFRKKGRYNEGLNKKYTVGLNIHYFDGIGPTKLIKILKDGERFEKDRVIITQLSHSDGYVQIQVGEKKVKIKWWSRIFRKFWKQKNGKNRKHNGRGKI